MLRKTLLAGLVLTLAVDAPAVSQQTEPTASAAAKIDAAATVADVRRILKENYVLPNLRPQLDAALARGLESGRYIDADSAELARRINADLEAVAHDKHLGIEFAPAQHAELAALPPGGGADDAPPSADDIRRGRANNHGIATLKLLPGNIRYLEYRGFNWAGPTSAAALDNAMRFLRDGDAVIIDLRGNGGGSPDAVQYLISHFLEANRPIVTFHMRGNPAQPISTLASLPAGRMVGKPLYVLTSSHTASAAEEFTGHVAGYKIGEVIGENTAGAGFRNEFFPVAGGFVISVSVGRAVLASTGKDWEGVGITPTTKTDQGKALDLAQARALRQIAPTARPEDRKFYEARAAVLEVQVKPVSTALPLASYAGVYGERSVSLDGSGLIWQRGKGPKLAIVAIDSNEFAFADDPLTRVRFTVAGNDVTGLELLYGDGSRVVEKRKPAS